MRTTPGDTATQSLSVEDDVTHKSPVGSALTTYQNGEYEFRQPMLVSWGSEKKVHTENQREREREYDTHTIDKNAGRWNEWLSIEELDDPARVPPAGYGD